MARSNHIVPGPGHPDESTRKRSKRCANWGYDLTTHTSKGLDGFNGKEVEVAITMGCGDECPLVLAKQRLDWQIPDPRDMTPEQFREVRNLIESKVKDLIATL